MSQTAGCSACVFDRNVAETIDKLYILPEGYLPFASCFAIGRTWPDASLLERGPHGWLFQARRMSWVCLEPARQPGRSLWPVVACNRAAQDKESELRAISKTHRLAQTLTGFKSQLDKSSNAGLRD